MYSLPKYEFRTRLEKLHSVMASKSLDAVYLSDHVSFLYFVGYSYLPTERPVAMIFTKDGRSVFFGPVLEKNHLCAQTDLISETYTYLDYPGPTPNEHPMRQFAKWMKQLRIGGLIGVDEPSIYPGIMGYEGPDLRSLLPDTRFSNIRHDIYNIRRVKSQNEIMLMRESIKWGQLAHRLVQDYIRPGLNDFEVDAKASLEATTVMKRSLGTYYRPGVLTMLPAYCRMNVQPLNPHALANFRRIEKGDNLSTLAGAYIDGYNTELERNLSVGRPSEAFVKYHDIALKLQQIALEKIIPGGKCSDPDIAVRSHCKENGLTRYLLHHSGHGLGLEVHEAPFLDVGDNTPFEEGMVTSVEPGIYVPKVGGFRHSDTVVVTKHGPEVLNQYPADVESLTVDI
jgi:Xaa-Pro aminopeptidase